MFLSVEKTPAADKPKMQNKNIKKKKSKFGKKKPQKPAPAKKLTEDENAEEAESDEEVSDKEPTVAEMEAVYKPENQKDIETVRSKKRKNHESNEEAKKIKKDDKVKSDIQIYLESWKNDKDNWKFAKLKQYYLQNNCFDTNLVEDDVWEIALEYLSGTKGQGRELILKRAKKLIDRIEEQVSKAEEKTVTDFPNYNRARQLMQTLQ